MYFVEAFCGIARLQLIQVGIVTTMKGVFGLPPVWSIIEGHKAMFKLLYEPHALCKSV